MLDLKMKRIQVTLKNPENGKLLRLTAVRLKLRTYIFISIILFLMPWAKHFLELHLSLQFHKMVRQLLGIFQK